jgi:hypothetical protein
MANRREEHAVQIENVCSSRGNRDVTVMRWIEAAAEEGYAHGILSRATPAWLRQVKDETHADLFDGIVVAQRTERIEPAIAKLGHAPVHDRKQLNIQPR